MNPLRRISKVFEAAGVIPFDDNSRFVLMSDVHRGDGSWADDFSRNQNIYFAALTHYFKENYTYVEIGDGDELWKNKRLSDIIQQHSHVFWLLSELYKAGRLYMIYGNHDMVKRDDRFVRNNLYTYYDERQKKSIPLFENIKIHEGLVLKHRVSQQKIFLIHGHQVSFWDYDIWWVSRFLVRYLWKPLELFGFNDPTSTAKNYKKKDNVETRLTEWVNQEGHMLIAGHTHRPMFPDGDAATYFNDGSSVHPRCITAIEIAGGLITLVKWCVRTREDGTLYIGREVLAGPRKLIDYFQGNKRDKQR